MFFNAGSERVSWPSKHQVFSLLKLFRHRSLNIVHENCSSTHIQNIQQIKSTHAILVLLLFLLDWDNMQIPQKESGYRRPYCVVENASLRTLRLKTLVFQSTTKALVRKEEARFYFMYLVRILTQKMKWCHQAPQPI